MPSDIDKFLAACSAEVAALLQDPKRILEGSGKRMRHVKVKSLDDLNEPLKILLTQAEVLSL